jgi:uncharacterized protein YndB with AHSA1/START domain
MSELHLTRIYRAPRSLVWQCWTDPAHVAQWWGPRGFSLTHHSKELRAGGSWAYTMHGPDGKDWPNTTRYLEVVEGEKLVYDHGSDGQSKPLFRVTVTFHDVPEGTRMEMTMGFESEEAARTTGEFIRKAGGNSTWDRLAEYLEQHSQGRESFVIVRSFAAPPELLFRMWTQPQHLSRWLAPGGASMEYLEADIRTGGSAFFRMDSAQGSLFARVHYQELQAGELIRYSQSFCDAEGKPAKHPGLPVFPESLETTVRFSAEREGTRVQVVSRPSERATSAERAAFLHTRDSMTGGWTGSFDHLEELLRSGPDRLDGAVQAVQFTG